MWSAVAIVAALALAVLVVAAVARTDWGQERARRLLIAQVASALEGRGRLTVGRFSGALGGEFVLDSVVLADDKGATVFRAAHVELAVDLAPLTRGQVRVRHLLLVRPFALFEQGHDGVWNVDRLFSSPKPKVAVRTALDISLDSAEVRDGLITSPCPTRCAGCRS